MKDTFNETTGEWTYLEPTKGFRAQGFTNIYNEGFVKVIPMNISNPNFFADIFQTEVIDKRWLVMDSTIAIMIEFYLYNPNLSQVAEKRMIIEFIETGGFINLEHQVMLMNMKLYRSFAQNA